MNLFRGCGVRDAGEQLPVRPEREQHAQRVRHDEHDRERQAQRLRESRGRRRIRLAYRRRDEQRHGGEE